MRYVTRCMYEYVKQKYFASNWAVGRVLFTASKYCTSWKPGNPLVHAELDQSKANTVCSFCKEQINLENC